MPGIQNSKAVLDFLGTIGTQDKGDQLPNVAKALIELGGFLIINARENLDKKGNVATGKTSESMRVKGLEVEEGNYTVPIELLSTYKFLDKGVKGVNGGSGKYSFKTKFVSQKMMRSIKSWMKTRSLSGKIKYKPVSKTESKNKKLHKMVNEAKSREALAYAIATNIKKKGIKPTLFFTKAIEATKKEAKKKLGTAFKLDIIEALNSN